jgi:selenocysteine lyase/cysteine desulfurase
VRLIGREHAAERAPTVAFTVQGRSCSEIGSRLGELNLGVGVGNFYAYRLLQALGIDPDAGALRTSFVHYTTQAEVRRLVETLDGLLS